jgi:hypothetical protein
MEQSPSWEAHRFSANQKIPCTLWDPKVHYHLYKSLHTCILQLYILQPPSHPLKLVPCAVDLSANFLDIRLPSSHLLQPTELPNHSSYRGIKGQPLLPSKGKRQSNPITGLDRPCGFQEVETPRFQDNRHMKVVRLSALSTGLLYPSGNILGTHFC